MKPSTVKFEPVVTDELNFTKSIINERRFLW